MQGSGRKHLAALVLCEDNLVRAYATVAEARAAHPRILAQHVEVKETGAKAAPQVTRCFVSRRRHQRYRA